MKQSKLKTRPNFECVLGLFKSVTVLFMEGIKRQQQQQKTITKTKVKKLNKPKNNKNKQIFTWEDNMKKGEGREGRGEDKE